MAQPDHKNRTRFTAQAPSLLDRVIRGQSSYIRRAAFISVITSLLAVTPTLYMMVVYNRVVTSRNETTLLMFLLCAIGIYALMEILELVRTRLLQIAGWQVDHALRDHVHDTSFKASLKQQAVGTQALSDVRTVREFIGSPVVGALLDSPSSLVFLAAIFLLNPWLGITSLIIAAVQSLIGIRTEQKTLPLLTDASRAQMHAQMNLSGVLRNTQVITAMGMKSALYKRWMQLQRKFLLRQAQASDVAGTNSATTKFIQTLQGSLLLGLSCWLTIKGVLLGGGAMMIVASMLGGRVLAPLITIISLWRQVIQAREAYHRLDDFLGSDLPKQASMSLPAPQGILTVESLHAHAPGSDTPLIRNMSFAAVPGEALLIAGPSAAGKSTLARLLVGAWPASAGKVRLDGADLHAWDKRELGPYIGYLPQNVELFDGSIAENIARFGLIDADTLQAAITLAGLNDFIASLPDGVNTRIGEEGAFLSGGQRQRIGIARAIYGNPKLIVLDEPNSSLDEAGEQALLNTLAELKARGCTIIVISHRTSILPAIDDILLMRDGMVHLYGSRDEVLARLEAPRDSANTDAALDNHSRQKALAAHTAQQARQAVIAGAA
jgi:ATP-binding cassette subfamily C exporter for protease/lipase